ncbi:hypothetical protein BDZ88DRAFT_414707 [Geranomyces variabilis]|nr:hypothetical protein BDZ88DRAFT_414707 [Geranomyces variabilis]
MICMRIRVLGSCVAWFQLSGSLVYGSVAPGPEQNYFLVSSGAHRMHVHFLTAGKGRSPPLHLDWTATSLRNAYAWCVLKDRPASGRALASHQPPSSLLLPLRINEIPFLRVFGAVIRRRGVYLHPVPPRRRGYSRVLVACAESPAFSALWRLASQWRDPAVVRRVAWWLDFNRWWNSDELCDRNRRPASQAVSRNRTQSHSESRDVLPRHRCSSRWQYSGASALLTACLETVLINNVHTSQVNGGSGPEATIIFNMNTKTFSQGGLMNIPRGYNANTLTTSDKVFTIGGSFARSYTDTRTGRKFGVGNKDGELWTQGANGGTWSISNPGSGNLIGGIEAGSASPDPEGIYRSDNHASFFHLAGLFPFRSSAGDDMIFHAGPSARMHTINLSKGTVTGAGFRSTDPYSMNGNAVQYSPGRVFKVGGAPYYGNSNSSVGMPTSAAAFTINYTGLVTGGAVQVRAAGNMNFKRSFGHALALPGGKILIVGGQSAIHLFSDTAGILTPELYSPDTGVFTQLAPMATARNYHSLALLLKDGRVLLAGGGAAQNACKTPGVKPCAPSTHFNAEIYTPPYLSAGQARPIITSASTGLTATYGPRLKIGGTLTVKATGCGTGGCSYELLRLHAATHSVDNDAARVPLQVAKRDATNGDQVHIFATDTPFVLSGYYYLFAIAADGTPSVATMVQVTRT